MRGVAVLGLTAGVMLVGCGGEAGTRTPSGGSEARSAGPQITRVATPPAVDAFAYSQMRKQSRRTCRVVPRRVLARSFARASGDPDLGGSRDPAKWTDNYVALAFAERVKITPIRLQQAAYDGCMAGLESRR